MNWDQVEGKKKQVKDKDRQKWGKFNDDELDDIDGNREEFVGRNKERYGKERAEKQGNDWEANY